MGCDIHIYCEAEEKVMDTIQWVNIDHYKKNKYFKINSYEEWNIVPIFDNRDYSLFSILAGVRNYSNNEPIAEPRGIPKDCSLEIKEACSLWECDGHTHSHLTLRELITYQKMHKENQYSGFISQKQSEALDNGIKPISWCRGTSDKCWIYREE